MSVGDSGTFMLCIESEMKSLGYDGWSECVCLSCSSEQKSLVGSRGLLLRVLLDVRSIFVCTMWKCQLSADTPSPCSLVWLLGGAVLFGHCWRSIEMLPILLSS